MSNDIKIFIGHHGTTAEACKKIRKDNFNKTHLGWIGSGVYFFEDDKQMALEWATMHCGKGKKEVLECTIKSSEVLDVSDPKSEQNKNFNKIKAMFYQKGYIGNYLINPKDKNFEAKVFDWLCKEDCYELVRNFTHTFTDSDRKNKQYRSKVSNAVELCVKNIDCIEIK